jgi:hypothetical protein
VLLFRKIVAAAETYNVAVDAIPEGEQDDHTKNEQQQRL